MRQALRPGALGKPGERVEREVGAGIGMGDTGAPPLKPRWPCLHLDLGSLASQPREIEFLLFQAQGVGFAETEL